MDKSLDEVIKENRRKFSINKKGRNPNNRRNNAGGGARKNKNNSPMLTGVAKNAVGRVTKKTGNRVAAGKKITQNTLKPNKVVDARTKLVAKQRHKILDARDRLAEITKKSSGDLRFKLSTKKPEIIRGNKTKPNIQGISKLVRELGTAPLTRTIIGRTVQNELARLPTTQSFARYEIPAHTQLYSFNQQPAMSYNFSHSTAAMDCEPPPPATKRIRATTDKRLGPREEMKMKLPPKVDQGHKIYISNLHHKVTEEDIAELFGDVGPLLRASLQRPGMAEVVYMHREDALQAVEVYHNRQLDGLPMHCSMGAAFDPRREAPASMSASKSRISASKANISPDINTIHKALFNKNSSSSSQIFTVTLPKKDV